MKIEEIFIKRGYTIDKNGDVYNPKEMRMKYAINASKAANKYDKEFVEKIREERKSGMKYSEIMEKYNLSKSTVSFIINHNYIIH